MMPETPFNHPLTTIETARQNTPLAGRFLCPFFGKNTELRRS